MPTQKLLTSTTVLPIWSSSTRIDVHHVRAARVRRSVKIVHAPIPAPSTRLTCCARKLHAYYDTAGRVVVLFTMIAHLPQYMLDTMDLQLALVMVSQAAESRNLHEPSPIKQLGAGVLAG